MSKYIFLRQGPANDRVKELSKQLGIDAGPAIYHIGKVNSRIAELEAQLAAKSATPAKAVTAPVATPAAKPAPVTEAPKLTGLLAVRAAAKADIAISNSLPRPDFTRKALPAVATTPEASAERPTRQQCEAIIAACDHANAKCPAGWTDDEVFAEAERATFQKHLTIPGARSAEVLSAEYWRPETLTGLARTTRAMSKEKIQSILASK